MAEDRAVAACGDWAAGRALAAANRVQVCLWAGGVSALADVYSVGATTSMTCAGDGVGNDAVDSARTRQLLRSRYRSFESRYGLACSRRQAENDSSGVTEPENLTRARAPAAAEAARARGLDLPRARPPLRPIPTWVIAVGVPVMVLIAAGTAWLLLASGATREQLDAVRTAGALGIGFGGAVGLWLAIRRQRSTELDLLQKYEDHELAVRAATHAEHDARERRITDLYLKAVEQRGSPQAMLRHGGLYALERLAQDNPSQRQTIVDVVCAYLRAPDALLRRPTTRRLGVRRPLLKSASTRAATAKADTRVAPARCDLEIEARNEREVRLTAQRLLARHLRPVRDQASTPTYWEDIALDLTGAVLTDFDLTECHLREGRFNKATFNGTARYTGARVDQEASFDGATFAEDARFDRVTVNDRATFVGTVFLGCANFREANFVRANFSAAQCAEAAHFSWATFTRDGDFHNADFAGYTAFNGANFLGYAGFHGVSFHSSVTFRDIHPVDHLSRTKAEIAEGGSARFANEIPKQVASYLATASDAGRPEAPNPAT
ncbi:pentapeptide repeat-containing protein [Saccharothrix sp. AJ9571]|nr:pentapeptide repeat-containing protein [Saccharothrix sp. AJ9571]